jgi:ABC-type ATPase with predicted acetyltransferase domain
LEALTFLEQFHYKSFAGASEANPSDELPGEVRPKASSSGGRKAVIVMHIKLFGQWQAAGYIELQMPLMMCKPRHELFDAQFEHKTRPIAWESWDQHAMKKYVNTIVRIGRVVVHPELRGLGLARHLINASKDFSKSRWQITGKRPIFLEISAEMLNYIDFVSSSGFYYVGHTEGNYARIVKDLSYMQKGYDVNSGIMSLQKKYLTAVQAYCRETRMPFEQALERLESVLSSDDPASSLSPSEWAAFRKVLRPKIPYYLCALDDSAEAYLKPLRGRSPPRKRQKFSVPGARIDIAAISVKSVVSLPLTRNVRIIMDAFGLDGDSIESLVLPPMPVKATAGNIVLVVGASGSGKSALLKALDSAPTHSSGFQVRINGARNYTSAWLKPLPNAVPIFDYFAERYSPERAFGALSQVGLSEAFVLVKPPEHLSRGQQYRAMLADLILRDEQVWLLDEFCADLDPLTARVVAHNLRRNVISGSRIAFVAAANHSHYLEALRPTQVMQLRTGGEVRFVTYKDYKDELLQQAC